MMKHSESSAVRPSQARYRAPSATTRPRLGVELASLYRPGGISDKRVARGLLSGMEQVASEFAAEPVIALDEHAPEGIASLGGFPVIHFRSAPRLVTNNWSLLRAYQRNQIDVGLFHHFRPWLWHRRSLTIIHDAIHYTHPNTFNWLDRVYLNRRRDLALGRGRVLAPTDYARRELAANGFAQMSNSRLITWGASNPNTPSIERRPTREPSFLVVGRITTRKRPTFIADAFRKAGSPGQLIFVGPIESRRIVADLARRESVQVVGSVGDEELEDLYAQAWCTIVASEVEGFGLQLVESLARGIPVIASDIPVFRETAAGLGGGVFFLPTSRTQLASAILQVSLEQPAMNPTSAVAKFDWSNSARTLLTNLLELAQSVPR